MSLSVHLILLIALLLGLLHGSGEIGIISSIQGQLGCIRPIQGYVAFIPCKLSCVFCCVFCCAGFFLGGGGGGVVVLRFESAGIINLI